MEFTLGGATVFSPFGLISHVFETEAFGSGEGEGLGVGDRIIGQMTKKEKAILVARNIVLTEIKKIIADTSFSEEEDIQKMTQQINVLGAWREALDYLLFSALEKRFANHSAFSMANTLGIRSGFQIVAFSKDFTKR